MKKQKIQIKILIGWALFFVMFAYFKNQMAVMTAWTTGVDAVIHKLGAIFSAVPFSVAEVLVACAVFLLILYIANMIKGTVFAKKRSRYFLKKIITLTCVGVSAYGVMTILWGVGYYAEGFQEKSGVYAEEVSLHSLSKLTAYFGKRASEREVPRDENGAFSLQWQDFIEDSSGVYDNIPFDFLKIPAQRPKALVFSELLSQLSTTGVYAMFTGEANINVNAPACTIPATIAHEMAHQRGIRSEQECNFLAVLACDTSGDPVYGYSGDLLAFSYLLNALYKEDPDEIQKIVNELSDGVILDLTQNREYWETYQKTWGSKLSDKLYDKMLKNYGEELGKKSYGAVVDLLASWYGPRAEEKEV